VNLGQGNKMHKFLFRIFKKIEHMRINYAGKMQQFSGIIGIMLNIFLLKAW
jgi:hypothetical protein